MGVILWLSVAAFIPTPLGLASYFSGGWYGGAPTCTTYQVTSIWCNLSSLALLTYMCVNCHIAVLHLLNVKSAAECQQCQNSIKNNTAPVYTSSSVSSAALAPAHEDNQHQASLSAEMLSDTPAQSSRLKNTTNCQNIDKEQLTNLSDNRTNTWTEADDDREAYKSTVCSEEQQTTQLFTEKRTVNRPQPKADSHHYDCYLNASSVTKGTCFNQSQISNLTDDDSTPIITQCLDAAVTNYSNVSLEIDCQFARDQPNERSLAKCLGPTSNGNLGATNGTKSDVKYSQLTPETMFQRLEDDSKNMQCCSTVTKTREQNSKTGKDHFCLPTYQSRDYVSMMIFVVYVCTFTISSLPLIGLGPRNTHTETSCRSWLVPIPLQTKERTFFMVYLCFVYTCLVLGCSSGISVCLKVNFFESLPPPLSSSPSSSTTLSPSSSLSLSSPSSHTLPNAECISTYLGPWCFWFNSLDGIPPCHHFRQHSIILCLLLSPLPLIFQVSTMFYNVFPPTIWLKNSVCVFLEAPCNI